MPESDIPNPVPARTPSSSLVIDWIDRQHHHALDPARFVQAARKVLEEAGIRRGSLSLAVVDDAEMHRLNRLHLEHDYPTDVLSFLLENPSEEELEGEVIVSADTADREARLYGWSLTDELLLYVIHGCLHLVGHDDHADEDREQMRLAEKQVLECFGLQPRWRDGDSH